jgi:diadenosine tetraphosphatase ApaH/serine/threonine PP2A family protein phosphatase
LYSVLEAAEGHYDEILCCGDLVGYGACPNETVDWSIQHVKSVVRGNHDKVAVGLDDTEGYNAVATSSLSWTSEVLSEANKAYLRQMPRGPLQHSNTWLMHGSPIDEDLYLIQECDARGMEQFLPGPVNFFGHTHRQGGFAYFRRTLRVVDKVPELESSSVLELEADVHYLINPGSVGQPRDTDWRAAYCIYDDAEAIVRFHRVKYDVDAAAKTILAAGLPELLAKRLFLGK